MKSRSQEKASLWYQGYQANRVGTDCTFPFTVPLLIAFVQFLPRAHSFTPSNAWRHSSLAHKKRLLLQCHSVAFHSSTIRISFIINHQLIAKVDIWSKYSKQQRLHGNGCKKGSIVDRELWCQRKGKQYFQKYIAQFFKCILLLILIVLVGCKTLLST